MIKQFSHLLSNFIYPSRCIYCRVLLEGDKHCCKKCNDELKQIEKPCGFCGSEEKDCNCKKRVKEYTKISAPFYFSELQKNAVHSLKFYRDTQIKSEMAKEMCACISRDFCEVSFDFVMGVPITKKRRNERGFNQADVLAKEISQRLSIPFKVHILDKIFENPPQHETVGKHRSGNVIGVYDINKKANVVGKTILLIDDVKTTSATLNECARVLKIYGAKSVYCSTFALTKPFKPKVECKCEKQIALK